MTVKEMEVLSGMTRANIRFYESEGLLAPARSANGYRDYSDHDLEVLKRIKLLRSLRIPLEEIQALHNDTDDLLHILDRHIAALEAERQGVDRADRVCREMRTDGVTYQTLDAQKYLNALDRPTEDAALSADVIPPIQAPWRRFFARVVDLLLYKWLWDIFLLLVCRLNISRYAAVSGLLSTVVILLLMLFLEPLLLHLWGTTPGKWIMGLSVADDSEGRLSYDGALTRTLGVLRYGMGWGIIPIYRLVRLWKSYSACVDGKYLPWEDEAVLSARQRKRWFAPVMVCAYAAVTLGATVLSVYIAEAPRHRGSITAAEFCDNVNRLADYEGVDLGGIWDENGQWQADKYRAVIRTGAQVDPPDFTFWEEKGAVTAVEFQFSTTNRAVWPSNYRDQMILSALSYAGVQEGFFGYVKVRDALVAGIQEHPYEGFSFTENGVRITCEVSWSGYQQVGEEHLIPEDGREVSYRFSFRMEKEA